MIWHFMILFFIKIFSGKITLFDQFKNFILKLFDTVRQKMHKNEDNCFSFFITDSFYKLLYHIAILKIWLTSQKIAILLYFSVL